MGEPLILDPNEPGGFRPAYGGGVEMLDPIDVGRYNDTAPFEPRGSQPSMAQRLSALSINGGGDAHTIERRPTKSGTKSKRDSAINGVKAGDKYQCYRFDKEGDDWQYARRRLLPATQSDMEKQVRKWKGSVLSETKKMGELRASQIKRIIDDLNSEEDGDGTWDVAWLESVKNGAKCTRMVVILARSNKSKSRSKSSASEGQIVDVLEPSKSKSKDKDKKKDKDFDVEGGDRKHERKDSVLDDPFQQSVLFHSSGKPVDEHGVLEFANGGLPPEIPRDRAIGSKPHDDHDKKQKKRGKSKDRGDDHGGGYDDHDIVKVDEHILDAGAGNSIEDILRSGGRSRRGSRSRSRAGEPWEPIEVKPGRSRSQKRQSSYHDEGRRSFSRRRSMSRPESIHVPHRYYGESAPSDAMSSVGSSESRYGVDREELSSYTSKDTYEDMVGRGSGYDDPNGKYYPRDSHSRYPPEQGLYKEHHRGPSASRSRGNSGRGTPRYQPGVEVYEIPASNRRRSRGFYAAIPEDRRIGFSPDEYAPGPLVRRSTYDNTYDQPHRYSRNFEPHVRPRDVKLHYPGEDMVDLKAREKTVDRERYAENYQRSSVQDDYLDRRERDLGMREARIDSLEGDPYYRGGYDDRYYR